MIGALRVSKPYETIFWYALSASALPWLNAVVVLELIRELKPLQGACGPTQSGRNFQPCDRSVLTWLALHRVQPVPYEEPPRYRPMFQKGVFDQNPNALPVEPIPQASQPWCWLM